jgi:hypothetical protein
MTLIRGNKFNLKNFMGPNKIISMHGKNKTGSLFQKKHNWCPSYPRGNTKVGIFLKTEDCEWVIVYLGKYGI